MMDNTGYGKEIKRHCRKRSKKKRGGNYRTKSAGKRGSNLAPQEDERALRRAYRSFAIPGVPKADIYGYNDQVRLHIIVMIKNQLKIMQSTKVIMTKGNMCKMEEPCEVSNHIMP